MAGEVRRTDYEGGVVLLRIDHPPMNALNVAMLRLLSATLEALDADLAVRAVVITGTGPAFCSGADLKEAARAEGGETLALFGKVLDQTAAARAPVIAAINGHCLGGGLELALCCDLRIAAADARFVCAGVNVGLMASTYRLPRLIGVARAKAMLLTGSPHDAATAEAWGLVTQVCPPEDLLESALRLARRIASRAPLSMEAAKRVADRALDLSPEDAAEMQARETAPLRRSRDHREALAAFAERREPVFTRQ